MWERSIGQKGTCRLTSASLLDIACRNKVIARGQASRSTDNDRTHGSLPRGLELGTTPRKLTEAWISFVYLRLCLSITPAWPREQRTDGPWKANPRLAVPPTLPAVERLDSSEETSCCDQTRERGLLDTANMRKHLLNPKERIVKSFASCLQQSLGEYHSLIESRHVFNFVSS